jgi:outer membrane protein OmpA-like peptidoglycan-associated protein
MKKKRGALGLSILDSRSNIDNFLIAQSITGNFLININFNKAGVLSFSFQPGFSKLRASLSSFTTGSQYVPTTGFDPNLSNGEMFIDNRIGYVTLDAGALWSINDKAGNPKAHLGFSIFTFNFPNNSFTETPSRAAPSYTLQAMINAYRDSKLSINPVLYLRTYNSFTDYSVGAEWEYKFSNYNPFDPLKSGSLKAVTLFNSKASFKWGITFDQPQYCIGLSYTTSSFSNRNTVIISSLEFGIKLKINKPKKEKLVLESSSVSEVRAFFEENPDEKNEIINQKDAGIVSLNKMQDMRFELSKDFNFGFNDAELNNEAKEYLDDIVNLLKENDLLHLKAIGHTDDIGSKQTNLSISRRRAESAINYLISQGIDSKRLRSIGKGDSDPLYPNETEENRSRNRRVELILYFPGKED